MKIQVPSWSLSGGVVEKAVTGNFSGLTAYCQKYILTSAALKTNTNARATVVYELEDQLIPLFQFGIFYHNDLEMLPGANMTFTGGRIHSNHNIYMFPQGTNTLTVDSIAITSAGSIIHKRKDSVSRERRNRADQGCRRELPANWISTV